MNKNIKKAGAGLLLSALVISGASAWLSTSKVGTSTNIIKPGTFSVKFANQKNAITLDGNKAIPMKYDYAVNNTTPYEFEVKNDSDVPVTYRLKAVIDSGDIDPSLIKVSILKAYLTPWFQFQERHTTLKDWVEGNANYERIINPKSIDKENIVIPYIDSKATVADLEGKSISFHLELEATQHDYESIYIEVNGSSKTVKDVNSVLPLKNDVELRRYHQRPNVYHVRAQEERWHTSSYEEKLSTAFEKIGFTNKQVLENSIVWSDAEGLNKIEVETPDYLGDMLGLDLYIHN